MLNKHLDKNAAQRSIAQGTLTRLRDGAYIPTQLWQQLKPWEIPYAHLFAYAQKFPNTIFSHESAALLHGLDFLRPPTHIHLLTTSNSRGRAQFTKKHVVNSLEGVPTAVSSENLQLTDVLRTLADCARILPRNDAVVLADSALRQGLITPDALSEGLALDSAWHFRKVRALPALASHLSESVGETMTRLALLDMNIPTPTEQLEVFAAGSWYRFDFGWEDYLLALEFDGDTKYRDYGPVGQVIRRERAREVALQNAGWRVLRTNWTRVVTQPHLFAQDFWAAWNERTR